MGGRASSRVARRVEEARSERVDALRTAAVAADAPRRTTALPAAPVIAPAIAQASADAPVTVQAYHQNTTTAPQAPQVVQASGRDDAFVF